MRGREAGQFMGKEWELLFVPKFSLVTRAIFAHSCVTGGVKEIMNARGEATAEIEGDSFDVESWSDVRVSLSRVLTMSSASCSARSCAPDGRGSGCTLR